MSIRILIADDHSKVRSTLKMVLGLWDDFAIVGEASNGQEAVHLSKELQPDVVLMDMDMPGMDGVEATRILQEQNPETRVLILTGTVDFDRIKVALAAGAVDYLLKTTHIDEIGAAIQRAVNSGKDHRNPPDV